MTQIDNGSETPRKQHTPSGNSGPVVVIAIGLIVVASAVVLALTVNTKSVAETTKPIPGAEPAVAQPDDAATIVLAAEKKEDKAAAKEELEQLPLELPNPVFAGTPTAVPKDVQIDRKRLGKRRPPFMAPKGLQNVAFEKPVTSSDDNPIIGSLDMVTDGDKEALDGRMVELAPGKQHVTIDLGAPHQIYAVVFWHNHMEPRVYRDVVVQISDDPEFKDAKVVYNNDRDNSSKFGVGTNYEYFESDEGELAPVDGVTGRYVRVWSKGSTADDQNHYSEVEVWGRPAKK